MVAPRVAALIAQTQPDFLLVGGSNDGKDVAGMLVGPDGPAHPVQRRRRRLGGWRRRSVEMSTFGGKLVTQSTFTAARGIVDRPRRERDGGAGIPGGTVETVVVDAAASCPR